jgi:outer membrane protein assembly factor BamA
MLIFASLIAVASLSAFIQRANHSPLQQRVIGDLIWEGNDRFEDARLSEILSVSPGDSYDQAQIQNLFNYDPQKNASNDITSFYMDQGHLFFSIEYDESVNGNKVDLTFELYEGPIVTVEDITIKGNQQVTTDQVLKMVELMKNEPFNRSKLIASQRNLAESGYFNPQKVMVSPIPDIDNNTVDIVFEVEEL